MALLSTTRSTRKVAAWTTILGMPKDTEFDGASDDALASVSGVEAIGTSAKERAVIVKPSNSSREDSIERYFMFSAFSLIFVSTYRSDRVAVHRLTTPTFSSTKLHLWT